MPMAIRVAFISFGSRQITPAIRSTSIRRQLPRPAACSGTITNPYTNLSAALAAAGASTTKKIVRIVGNTSNKPYLVGYKDAARLQPLVDGGDFMVPQNVTVMVDAGAIFKMRRSNLSAGTTPQGLVSRSGGAIQVLGTPTSSVVFTSYADDTVGGDSDGPSAGPLSGDYGGIVFRDDSDREVAQDVVLTLAGTQGATNHFVLAFNGVEGSAATQIENSNATTAANILDHLNSIPALTGKVSVIDNPGFNPMAALHRPVHREPVRHQSESHVIRGRHRHGDAFTLLASNPATRPGVFSQSRQPCQDDLWRRQGTRGFDEEAMIRFSSPPRAPRFPTTPFTIWRGPACRPTPIRLTMTACTSGSRSTIAASVPDIHDNYGRQ